uniref:Mini-chromosome maintenance complex-binding protein n=1 Tax=Elaeophora elaphi TaxID=1147741 RepID=A0A0R3S6M5_9BILA
MESGEAQDANNSQNATNVKTWNENFTIQSNPSRESQENNEESVYNEVDNLFSENVAEYTKDPCKLLARLKEKYKNEFKNWKYLYTDGVKHGDLVRVRGMILSGMQTVFSLNAAITEEEDGSTRTNIKEIKGMTRRNAYILVPERGVTDWYLRTFNDYTYVFVINAKPMRNTLRYFSRMKNRELMPWQFYDEESENFKPNVVFDLYGIVDLAEIRVEDDDDGPNAKNSLGLISIHVIYYERVKNHDIVSSVYPEVLRYKNTQGFESLIYAFKQLLGNKVIAQSLACQLFVSQHLQTPRSIDTFPYTIKKVYDSKLIIEMIKLFVPKVHVVEMMQKTMEESWASYERPQGGFEQGLLQVSDNTLIIIDETKLSLESLSLTKKGRENCNMIKNFLSTRKIPFIYPYQTVEIESTEDFAIDVPESCPKDVNFVRQYATEHESELNLCRHALLSCSKSLCNVKICKTIEEMAVENFLRMQRIYRNADDNSARLLTSLKGEKIVDEDCWRTAIEFENELRIMLEACCTDK